MSIPLALLKSHVRVDFSDDDALLSLYLSAAVSYFERATRTLLSQQTRTLKRATFRTTRLPFPPFVSVTSVAYVDTAGASQTLSSSLYKVDRSRPIAVLSFLDNLPSVHADTPDPVTITYVCGWNDAPTDVVRAVLELAAGYYLTRESVATIQFARVPFGVDSVIANRAVPEFEPEDDP